MKIPSEAIGFPRKCVFVKIDNKLTLWSASEPYCEEEAVERFGKDSVAAIDAIQYLDTWGDLKSRARWALGMGKFN